MATEDPKALQRGFEIRSSIPVLRMLDEAKAKAFYLGYLGFEVDWEGRFNPTAPLYMQIHLGEAIIHLNGHAEEDAPISQVNIPVVGLEKYCQYLIAKGADYPKPCVVDPRFRGRNTDMNIDDPFGNELVFCSEGTEVEEPSGVPAPRWAVEWRGRRAGWVAPPAFDESGICSGPWWPGEAAADFLAQVAAPAGEGVRVALGGIPAWVRSPPDASGIVAFWLHVNPRARELPGPQDAEPGAAPDRGGPRR
jgi:hypothetical protein